jgi:hypothetical protein
VRFVFGFAWDRSGGRDLHPWLGEAWTRRAAQTATPTDRLPVVRGWEPQPVATPAPKPDTPVGPPVPPHDGGHGHTTAIVTAASASAAVAAVALALAARRRKAGERLTATEQAMITDSERRMRDRHEMAKGGGQ